MHYKNMCIKVLCIHTYITLIYNYLLFTPPGPLFTLLKGLSRMRFTGSWPLWLPNGSRHGEHQRDLTEGGGKWGQGACCLVLSLLEETFHWRSLYLSRRPILQTLLLLGSQNWMLSSSPLDIEAVCTELLLPPGFCTILGWNCTHPFLIVLCAICFLLGP